MKQMLDSVSAFFEMWTDACYTAHVSCRHDWAKAQDYYR